MRNPGQNMRFPTFCGIRLAFRVAQAGRDAAPNLLEYAVKRTNAVEAALQGNFHDAEIAGQ
ncbi:hypothetical protein D3C76_1782880 [compost metagenome]